MKLIPNKTEDFQQIPEPGQLVEVRRRQWVVTQVDSSGAFRKLDQIEHLVTLESIDEDSSGEELQVIWQLEVGAKILEKAGLPNITGYDPNYKLDAFLDAVRWGAASNADRKFLQAPFRSGITIEDYQLDPLVRAIDMARVNLLIADDVDLGKTIEAGLVIQELLIRHWARTVLVVCPASLQVKWQMEMQEKFGLEFRIVDTEYVRMLRRERGLQTNPWTSYPRLITSMDWIKSGEGLRLLKDILPPQITYPRKFDILVVDEAHNVAPAAAAAYSLPSQRTQVIQRLTPHFTHHLFLTATPHNGYQESFTSLLELLDDQRFAKTVMPNEQQLQQVMIRRLKNSIVDANGNPVFPKRELKCLEIDYTPEDEEVHQLLREFTESRMRSVADSRFAYGTKFVHILLKKRLFSSPAAFAKTLAKHQETLMGKRKERKTDHFDNRILHRAIMKAEEEVANETIVDEAVGEVLQLDAELTTPLTAEQNVLMNKLLTWAEREKNRVASKAKAILDWINKYLKTDGKWNNKRVILFTEYRDTHAWLHNILVHNGVKNEALMLLHGETPPEEREAIKAAFQTSPEISPVRILLATDAASEGIDLQNYCNYMIHVEIPWNPNVMEQRNGRIDRHGQKESSVFIWHPVGKDFTESAVQVRKPGDIVGDFEYLMRAAIKIDTIREDFCSVGPVIARQIEDAMLGNGSILDTRSVEEKRKRARKLVAAEKAGKFINADGIVCESASQEPLSDLTDERMNTARRLIAEKCLYGVDINPLAVELAKLSIWLVTISKGRLFGFLDHNLKSGDSLLGIHDIEQLRQLKMKPDDKRYSNLLGSGIGAAVDEVLELREMIREVNIWDITDVEYMASLHQEAQENLTKVKLLADLFIDEALTCKPNKLQNALDSLSVVVDTILASDYEANRQYRIEAYKKLNTDLPDGKPPRRPFHWALEFPEVFQNGGFDAVCGNPPFSGGQHLTGTLGTAYRDFMVNHIANGAKGSADLVAYFYLNVYDLLKQGGVFGLIACNTIAEGDTRQVGLERLLKQGATIIAANPNMPWPGKAAVVISPVFVAKDIEWHGKYFLSDTEVETISAFLSAQEEWSPKVLEANKNQSFQGSIVLGLGFTMSEDEAKAFIAKDLKNAEVLFPYLNGDDLNSDPEQKPSRWVINFFDWPLDRDAEGSWTTADERKRKAFLSSGHVPADYPSRVAADFPDLLDVVREKVKPERDESADKTARTKWWLFLRPRAELYHAIGRGASFAKHPDGWDKDIFAECIFASARVGKYFTPSLLPNSAVFHEKVVVMRKNDFCDFAFMNSSMVQDWVWKNSSTLGTGLNFSPSDSFETLPFPYDITPLQNIAILFDQKRKILMREYQCGLTALYNKFHDSCCESAGILKLRELLRDIDNMVCQLYGWKDISLEHSFHKVSYLASNDNIRYTISEPARIEIFRRLAVLNKKRYEEEQL